MSDENKREYSVLLCYHCGNKTLMEQVAKHKYYEEESLGEDELGRPLVSVWWSVLWNMFECPVCHEVTLQRISVFSEEYDHTGRLIPTDEIVYPKTTTKSTYMPKNVAKAFEAAVKVRHIEGAICALSLRRTLEMMCKDKKATGKDLYNKLKSLSDKGLLPPILNDMGAILRDLGNAAAHADDTDFPRDIVDAMIDFTQTILDYVYTIPESLAAIQKKIATSESLVEDEAISEA